MYIWRDVRLGGRRGQTFREVWLWSREGFKVKIGERGRAEEKGAPPALSKTQGPIGGRTWDRRLGEGEVPMGEIGGRQKRGRLYRMLHPAMRKMQAKQIWGVRKQKETERRGRKI